MSAPIRVIVNRYGVEVFAGDDFLGGITDRRIVDGAWAVGDAVASILRYAGHPVTLEREQERDGVA